MSNRTLTRWSIRITLLLVSVAVLGTFSNAVAQSEAEIRELHQKADAAMKDTTYIKALPYLEKLVVAEPTNPQNRFNLGFALIAAAKTKDDAHARALRIRARESFLKAKELGLDDPLIPAMVGSLPPDGAAGLDFSPNPDANKLMKQAEDAFSSGDMDKAFKNYQKALELDPTIYEAALFSGDVYVQKNDFEKAEYWYQKAIGINPNRETAYRYSATPFMKQKKYDQARDRYFEAYITEPYSRFPISGLTQWAQATNTSLAHPDIKIPTSVTFDDKGNIKVDLDASALLGGKEDGSFAWIAYGATRKSWHDEKFAKAFPNETTYRHSLPEEAEALRLVIKMASTDKDVKKLSPSLQMLKKLDDAGLLEAYILLAIPDRGIAEDHPAYLDQNRDKLRQYVIEFVVGHGGR